MFPQITFNTRHKIEKHKLIVMDKSIQEEKLAQPLQTNIKQFKIAVTFFLGCNSIFNITEKKTITSISRVQLLMRMVLSK